MLGWRTLFYIHLALLLYHRASGVSLSGKKEKPPLVEEIARRKTHQQTHCQFGNASYELEERWRPDLGHPFGVLYCVRCECIAVQRKNRIIARAKCKNIKNDCPKPTCDNPVLLQERCCKTCIGQDYANLEEDIATRKLENEDDDNFLKEFSVLLTGRGMRQALFTEGVARGYLTYSKRDLHYTVHYRGMKRPDYVRFHDEEGNILVEHKVEDSFHHENKSKICGVWKRVPKVYRRVLQKEKLLMYLTTKKYPDGQVGGRILKNNRISTEIFSSLLLPENKESQEMLGSGGIAGISTVATSIHLVIEFTGIFSPKDSADVAVFVSLKENTGKEAVTLSQTVITLPKVYPEHNTISAKLDLTHKQQESLSKGRTFLEIRAPSSNKYLNGPVLPKTTCNVFQALMAADEIVDGKNYKLDITGFLLFNLEDDGSISYKLHMRNAVPDISAISLETSIETSSGLDVQRLVEYPHPLIRGNWANGTFPLTGVQEMEMLMTDDLMVGMTTSKHHRRKIRQRLYTEAVLNEYPILLYGEKNSSAAGMAWLYVDRYCILHYQVYVAGLNRDHNGQKERHLLELLEVPGPSVEFPQQRILKKFDGEQAEDAVDDLNARTLANIHSGNTYLLITSKVPGMGKTVELKTRIEKMPVPSNCFPEQDLHYKNSLLYQEDGSNNIYSMAHKCFYEGTIFDDGVQWKGEHANCTMCSCKRGRVVCDRVMCPQLTCEYALTLPGECCPSCPGAVASYSNRSLPGDKILTAVNMTLNKSSRSCYFDGDKKFHLAGTRWHPYIPPFGFSKCAMCTCEIGTLVVECKRMTCPSLPCPEKESFREHPLACCKKCPITISVKPRLIPTNPGQLGDEGAEKFSSKELMFTGGCKLHGQFYKNGDEWHPTVPPFGQMKCVKCHCKDGRTRCKRQKCVKLVCSVKVHGDDECCPRCIDAEKKSDDRSLSKDRRKKKEKEKTPKISQH